MDNGQNAQNTQNSQNAQDVQEKNREKKQTLIIAIVVVISLVYLTNWFADYLYFDGLSQQVASKQQELTALETEHHNLEQIKSNLLTLEKNSSSLEDDYKKLAPLIPEEKELPDILSYLYQAGTRRNLRLSHFSQSQKISRQGALNQLPITVSVLGSDDDILRYLNDFVRFNRILNIDNVKVTEETNPKYIGAMNAEIKFSAYVSDPNTVAANAVTANTVTANTTTNQIKK
jgi:Tfp pilus assembly protein PilO